MQAYLGTGCQVVVCRTNVLWLQGECMPSLHEGQRPEHVHAVPVLTRMRPQTGDYLQIVA